MWQGPLTIHLFICLVLQRSKGREPRLVHRGISGTLFPRPSQTPHLLALLPLDTGCHG